MCAVPREPSARREIGAVQLGVVFRKVSQRRLVISFLGQHGSGCTTLVRSPESGSPICSQQMNPLLSTRSRREHPKRRPPGEVSPRTGSVRLRPQTFTRLASQFDRRVASGHCGRLSCQATRPLFLKIAPVRPWRNLCLLPPQTSGAFAETRVGKSLCLFQGSVTDAQAAISLCFCRQWVASCRDRDHLSQRAMPQAQEGVGPK